MKMEAKVAQSLTGRGRWAFQLKWSSRFLGPELGDRRHAQLPIFECQSSAGCFAEISAGTPPQRPTYIFGNPATPPKIRREFFLPNSLFIFQVPGYCFPQRSLALAVHNALKSPACSTIAASKLSAILPLSKTRQNIH
jgi:hypothetical protein